MESCKMVFVPVDALKTVVCSVREQEAEKHRLLARIKESRKRVQMLQNRSATKRVSQLEMLMAVAKEVSAQSSFESVIERTLRAAVQLVRADKFTLGILHERRNVLDVFSTLRNEADADVDLSFVKVDVINEVGVLQVIATNKSGTERIGLFIKVDGEDELYIASAADIVRAEAVGTSLHKASLHREVRTSQKLIEARLRLTTFISESTDIAEFVDMVMELDAYKHELFDPSVDMKTGYRTTSVLCMPVFEDHSITIPPKVVAVAMCINKKEGAHVVAFTKTDREIMTKYCAEVQFALGRLSLDISYYKVVSDCVAVSRTGVDSSARVLKRMSTTNRIDKFSETDIISSIVHKYCHSGDEQASESQKKAVPSFAALLPVIKKKSHEDDEVPFPREILFTHGRDEPLDHWDTETISLSSSEAQEWGARLLDEFQNQAAAEAEHGVPTDYFMQNLENKRVRITVHLSFINYVIRSRKTTRRTDNN
eukprot:jgi/Phyca11/20510/fgenesh1_pg.PHYCAscaffold_65_\